MGQTARVRRQAKRSGLHRALAQAVDVLRAQKERDLMDVAQIIRDFLGRSRLRSKLSMRKFRSRAKTFCLEFSGGKKPCTQWEGLHTCLLAKGHFGQHKCGGRDCGHRWSD